MLGVYVHIPFCLRKCGYCDFHSTAAAPPVIEAYLQALANEIEFWARQTAGELCSTLYIGGGTPTILTPGQLDRILTKLASP